MLGRTSLVMKMATSVPGILVRVLMFCLIDRNLMSFEGTTLNYNTYFGGHYWLVQQMWVYQPQGENVFVPYTSAGIGTTSGCGLCFNNCFVV